MARNKVKILTAFGWKFAEKIAVQGASFLLTLILARKLSSEDYGVVALVVVFTSISSTFVQGGFNTALIQKKDPSGSDYVSVLCVSLAVAVFLYVLLFIAAPYIAVFYRIQELCVIMRVMAFILIPSALTSVQIAYVTRDLRFRELGICNFVSIVVSAGIGIAMAYMGFGVWALVVQQIGTQIVLCIMLLAVTKWIPKGTVRMKNVKQLIPFGSRILCQNLMVQIFLNIRSLIIGRVYTTSDLGYFNRGKSFPQTIMESVNGTIQTVLLPVYSKEQENQQKVVSMMRRMIQISSFVLFPMVIGMACIAKPLVRFLLTDRWLPCVPYLQIFAIGYIFNPIQTSSAQAYKAIGDSSTPLRIEIIRKAIEFSLLLASIRYGVLAIALSTLVNGFVGTCVTFIPNSKKLGYTIKQQLADLLPPLLLSAAMGGVVLLTERLFQHTLVQLAIGILIGVCFYIAAAKLLGMKTFAALVNMRSELKHEREERT